MAYTTIDDPSAFFQTKIYTGNGSTQSITFDGNSDMQPNMNWTKVRSETGSHRLTDDIRGLAVPAFPNGQDAEGSEDNYTSFDSDGFSLKNNSVNENTRTYVSWCWKTGTAFSNDASSTSIGSVDSSGSVNDTAGFSIVSWTGTGANATLKHGLSTAPSWILVKNRADSGENWVSFHERLGPTLNQKLNNTEANQDTTGSWNDTAPTTSIFTVGSFTNVNKSSGPMIAFCWAEKKGYSKFGSFVGNNNADGAFVYLGFTPSFLLVKNSSSAEDWIMFDNKREPNNEIDSFLRANTSAAETTSGRNEIDLLSNGFKARSSYGDFNGGSGDKFVYMAFAERPIVTSTGVPATAR